jgi:SAM-dependent methyltransferase
MTTPQRVPVDKCPICHHVQHRRWLHALGFELVQCEACDHRYATEVLALQALSDDYYNEDSADLEARSDTVKRQRFEEYRALVPELRRPGRVLDVGCNAGELLSLFQQAGWDVAGVEMSPGPAALAAKRLDAPVFNGTVEDYELDGEPFDLITLSHVLEHLHDPRAVLERLAALAAPGGGLLVEVPNADDLLLPAFGGFYRPLCPGDHVSFFDHCSLDAVISTSGWEMVATSSPLHARDVFYGSLMSTLDAVRTRGGQRLDEGGGVASQTRYRGRFRETIKSVLDVVVEAADPLVTTPQRHLATRRGAVLIAYARRKQADA